jgi:hypothetical protein
MKKKPLDAGKMLPLAEARPGGTKIWVLLALAGIVAALAFIGWLLVQGQPGQQQGQGSIDLIVYPSPPIFEGAQVDAKAFSSCGSFQLFLDGEKIADGEARAEARINASMGTHTLVAKNSQCSREAQFSVFRVECQGNSTAPCDVGGCSGVKQCAGGLYSECVLPKRICVPGEKSGCTLNACQFGYATCDKCGTGFGPCEPADGSAAIQNAAACPPGIAQN